MPTTVLIADDDAGFRDLVRRVLGGAVEVVAEASDGEEAVQLAAGLAPDVVLMDLDIPGLNAIAAAWRIKADRSATKIILLTTHDEEAYLGFTGKTGADAFLRKQDLKAEIHSQIRALLGQAAKLAWDGRERRGKGLGPSSAWDGKERRRKPGPKKFSDDSSAGPEGS